MFAAKNTTTSPSPSSITNKGANAFIQPKLSVGKPGDKYEVEADKAADQIVAKSNEPSAPFFPATPTIQKQEAQETDIQQQPVVDGITTGIQLKEDNTIQKTEEEEVQQQEESGQEELQMMTDQASAEQMPKSTLQTKETSDITPSTSSVQKTTQEDIQGKEDEEIQEKEEEEVQTLQKQASGDEGNTASIENDLNASKGGGSPLDSNTKSEMESGFGTDFSGVRVHNDNTAVQMNQQLGSQAFANGNDIYFNEGKYNPGSDSGKHLLAHELTHTVQQGASDTKSVQKTEDEAPTTTPIRPTGPIDISQRLDLNDEWAAYLDHAYSEGERTFDLDVKIGESYRGTIKVNKKRGTAEGETAKYDLARGNDRYLEISGWSFLNPLRQVGVTPILVLREFGDGQQTTGFLSVKTGDVALVADVQGFIRGLNENLETMSFLGIEPLNVDGLENTFENGRLVFQVSSLTTVVDGFLEAGGGLGITGETFTFNLNANVDVAGLATGEFTIARGEDGSLSGTGEIQADIANVQATIRVEYIEGLVTIQGTGRINSEKFSGEITLLVTDEARSTQMMHAALGVESMDAAAEDAGSPAAAAPKTRNNQVLAGWGEIQATITPWLEGTAKVGIDNEGHVTVVGEIIVPDEIELMEQRGKKVDLFDVEIRAGYGIPLVGQVFLFASVGMFVNAGFGPLVLKDIGFTGTYSTDPNVLQQFSITGTLGINAFAVIGLEAEAGVGVTILGHDVKAGVNVTAAAGIRAYAEATPTFEYSESQAPEGGKIGESHLRGHFEAAAQLFLQLTGALFYELDSPWWSPAPDGREEYPLGEVQYPIGDSMGIGADIDWLVGSPDAPELTFSPVEFDPDKFTADVMADPPPRTMGDADAEPEGAWTGEPGSEQNENPEITGDGEGLPPNSRREEDLSNLPDEQKYMRALDEMSRLETASPRPTLSVVEAEARKVKRKYGVAKIETRDEQDNQVSVYVEHARENNGRHLLNIPLMSTAERLRLLASAMENLRTRENSTTEEDGTIEESAAQSMIQAWLTSHPVIENARVIDGGETWNYFIDIGDRNNTETGKRKKQDEETGEVDLQEGDGEIGKVVRFDADSENHRIWVRVAGTVVDVMIASTQMTIAERIADWRSRLDTLDATQQRVARGFLDSAELLYNNAKDEAVTAKRKLAETTTNPTPENSTEAVNADNEVEETQDRMVSIFRNLFTIFGDTDNEDTMYLGFERDITTKTHLSATPMLQGESRAIFEANKAIREASRSQGFTSWSGLINKFKSDAPKTKEVIEKPITNTEAFGTYTKGQVERAANRKLEASLSDTEKQGIIDQKIIEIEGGQARNAFASLRDQVFDREREPTSNERLDSVFNGEEGEHSEYKILSSTVDYDGTTDGILIVNYHYTVQIGDQPPEENEFTITISQSQLDNGAHVTNHNVNGRNIAIKDPGSRGSTNSASNADSRSAIQDASSNNSANRDNVLNVPDQENHDDVMDEMRDQFSDQIDDTTIKFNASHLIADWFQGSGYSLALNLITTSEHYNKQIMFGAESSIKQQLEVVERRAKRRPNVEYITFDMNVVAEWMAISDTTVADKIAAETATVSGETPEQRQKRLEKLHTELSRDRDPKFCNSVLYNVETIHLKDKDGNIVDSEDSSIEAKIGQDTHLKEILKKQ